MENKTKDMLIGALSIVVVALLIIVIVGNSNPTGNPIWDFLKSKEGVKDSVGKNSGELGLLGDSFVSSGGDVSSLKGYKVQYDDEGNLVYEILEDQTLMNPGKGYIVVQEINDPNLFHIESQNGGELMGVNQQCGCKVNTGVQGSCTASCTGYSTTGGQASCGGQCTGTTCSGTKCALGEVDPQ